MDSRVFSSCGASTSACTARNMRRLPVLHAPHQACMGHFFSPLAAPLALCAMRNPHGASRQPEQTARRRRAALASSTATAAAAARSPEPSPMQPGRASGTEAADGANRAVLTDEEWRRVHSRREGFDDEEEDEYLSLSSEEIEDRIDAAAAFISVVHDLRPLDPRAFNASLEVWRQIRRVPPWCRHRLLSELEPGTGAIRALWKASMARYVLDDACALELARGWTIWQDFPEEPGQVYNYVGKCEQFVLTGPQFRFFKERGPPEPPRPAPWLKPTDGSYDIQAQDFRMQFFVQPQTGELFARVVFPWLGTLLERWWLPVYLRLKMELTLTPLKGDAGADLTFEYAFPDTVDLNGWLGDAELLHEQLPDKRWPRPDPLEACGSPFSISPRDYVRPAGPGVYVGCAYRGPEPGVVNEDECVFFVIARKMSRDEYEQHVQDRQ